MSEFMNQYRRSHKLTWEVFERMYGDSHRFTFSWRGCREYPNGVLTIENGGEVVVA